MDMNETVNQTDSINYNWPLLAVTQGLSVECEHTLLDLDTIVFIDVMLNIFWLIAVSFHRNYKFGVPSQF